MVHICCVFGCWESIPKWCCVSECSQDKTLCVWGLKAHVQMMLYLVADGLLSHDVIYLGVMGMCPHNVVCLCLRACVQVMVWSGYWGPVATWYCAWVLGACDHVICMYDSVKCLCPCNSIRMLTPGVPNMLHGSPEISLSPTVSYCYFLHLTS